MSLLFYDKELLSLMENFYILTNMKIVLFDEDYNEIAVYPVGENNFCRCMRQSGEFDRKCRDSDRISFEQARKTKKLAVYTCHAGLVEATAPITENDKIIGYMMFGQITDEKNREEFTDRMQKIQREYGIKDNLLPQIKKIRHKNSRQIQAAAKILEACTSYIRLKEIIHFPRKRLIDLVEEFIDSHISEEITPERLCGEFNMSRTRFYDLMRQYTGCGIAAFIKQKRLRYAKYLIETTDMTVTRISREAGFSDYNYFRRVFRQHFGISPGKLKKDI